MSTFKTVKIAGVSSTPYMRVLTADGNKPLRYALTTANRRYAISHNKK